MNADLIRIVDAMQEYGGSFAKAFGIALLYADDNNARRLMAALPEVVEEYRIKAGVEAFRSAADRGVTQ